MMKVYLADLRYDTVRTNYGVPLNVGYIAAFAKRRFGSDVEISIFKSPSVLVDRIRESPPDLLGMSNYYWNTRLNSMFLELGKSANTEMVTVLGGPNIRTDPEGLADTLGSWPLVDHYVLYEGEEPFAGLIERYLSGNRGNLPPGVASIQDGEFVYTPVDLSAREKELDLPSPYLNGMLDEFIQDPDMIPLFETNRGCPFGCTYCVWGDEALKKIRVRDIDIIHEELEYVAKHSHGQASWIFADANFGVLQRDIQIAQHIREIADRNGFPNLIHRWDSKNTTDRNIEISKILNNKEALVALQSTDQAVLERAGRGRIRFEHLKKQIGFFRENGVELRTDVLLGLPGESVESHLETLRDCFDLGFAQINTHNIVMLPGSEYETEAQRKEFGIETQFRPMFGAYGSYDGKLVFEIEECVRSTNEMTDSQFEEFKLLHWLIWFCWNSGIFRPLLRFAHRKGVSPVDVFLEVLDTTHPELSSRFERMKQESLSEWFSSYDEMEEFYSVETNFSQFEVFTKLNQKWISEMLFSSGVDHIREELIRIVWELVDKNRATDENDIDTWLEVIDIVDMMICKDLCMEEFSEKRKYSGAALACVLDQDELVSIPHVEVDLYRGAHEVSLSQYYLRPDGVEDLSIRNLIRFFEIGGLKMVTNRIELPVELREGKDLTSGERPTRIPVASS